MTKKLALLLAAIVLTSTGVPLSEARAQSGAAKYHDWVVVPGVRVGPIGRYTSAAALASLFVGAKIRHRPDRLGFRTEIGLRSLGADGRNADIIVRWEKAARHRLIRQVAMRASIKFWRTPEGIAIATPLAAVQAVNGRPFPLSKQNNYLLARRWGAGKLAKYGSFSIGFSTKGRSVDMSTLPDNLMSNHPALANKDFRVIGFVVTLR